MLSSAHRWALFAGFFALSLTAARSQVFVVGEKSATSDLSTDFTPTNLSLPDAQLSERGRRELVRNLEAEQGFAHRALPLGAGLTLRANGPISPGPAEYRKMIFEKGQSAAPGDRVIVTALQFKGDRIIIDLNGGPYVKHRFLSHIQLNNNPVVADTGEKPMGCRVTLVFEGHIPEISAPEIKALLEPVIDFGVKSTEQAYADTLPVQLKNAIAAHDVLVGMNHRMVLAALGAPESKVREQASGDANGTRYEEWIYGHVPQTIRFIRFVGDRVTTVEIAALGKPIEIHDKDEMAGYQDPANTREIAMGDRKIDDSGEGDHSAAAPPTLRKPGEAAPPSDMHKVQYPTDSKKPIATAPRVDDNPSPPTPPSLGSPTATTSHIPGADPHLQ